jgi:threonine dehydratase
MFNKLPIQGKKVVSVVSGGNIDVTSLSRVIQRGLMKSGRSTRLVLELMDKPGQLTTVSGIISALGGNVIGVRHERTAATRSVNGCYLTVEMETRNYAHVEEIVTALKSAGFNIIED